MNQIGLIALSLSLLAASAGWSQTFDPVVFEAELIEIDDPRTLDNMADERSDRAMRSSGDAQLALGMILLRRWELSGEDRYLDRARDAFERVRDIAPDDPWGHWGHGLTLARGPGVRSHEPGLAATGRSWARMLGFDDRAKARRSLEKALEIDPRFDRAAAVLAELALQERDPDRVRAAYDVLLRVLSAGNVSEHSLIMLARVADALGDHETAIRAGELATLAPRAPIDAVHAFAVALLRTRGQEEAGARVYFTAVERMTPMLAARLWAETSPIARPGEIERWEAATLEEKKQLIRDLCYCDADTRERVRTYARAAFSTDTHRPAFDSSIPFGFDLFAFRGSGGR
ncbi:MAG: hypothetical protein L0271_11980, partial [Gemmatimonadetes bacterium]|nr:hypothetical protein [Gemmatimonadota bacterium]